MVVFSNKFKGEKDKSTEQEAFVKRVADYQVTLQNAREQIAKLVVGQEEIINSVFRALFANGHILLEGVPGTAKTLMVRTISQVTGCEFKRIQFTPDLLPSDIVGMTSYQKEKGFFVVKGPVFANFVLADEINRAPPKVQSALLQAMQERDVTIGKETLPLPVPFFVLATQNPVEQMGTYPLPEAQVDRFLFKLYVNYPPMEDEIHVLDRNMTIHKFENFQIDPVFNPELITQAQEDAKKVYLDKKIELYIVSLIDATRYPDKYKIKLGKYIEYGGSPRASIGLFIAAKADALLNGKTFVLPTNVKRVAPDILRHRILLNYEAQSEGISSDQIVEEVLNKVPVP